MTPISLNFRSFGGISTEDSKVPDGMLFRSGKLSVLSKDACMQLMRKHKISCVIDLRTPIEISEYPDPLPKDVEYVQIPLLKDSTVGISHETGSDAMTIIKSLKKHPEKLKEMVPDFPALYKMIVTDEYCRSQLNKVLDKISDNMDQGKATLFHCTAGKDRTGIVAMALLKKMGCSDEVIIKDYMLTNRSAFFPTIKKCIGVWLLTQNWTLVKTAYRAFMVNRELIKVALDNYK